MNKKQLYFWYIYIPSIIIALLHYLPTRISLLKRHPPFCAFWKWSLNPFLPISDQNPRSPINEALRGKRRHLLKASDIYWAITGPITVLSRIMTTRPLNTHINSLSAITHWRFYYFYFPPPPFLSSFSITTISIFYYFWRNRIFIYMFYIYIYKYILRIECARTVSDVYGSFCRLPVVTNNQVQRATYRFLEIIYFIFIFFPWE